MALTFDEQRIKDEKCGKGKLWCQRTDSCIKPCGECKAPYVVEKKFYCSKKNYCQPGEQCIKNTCRGIQYGLKYSYKPRETDPCISHN